MEMEQRPRIDVNFIDPFNIKEIVDKNNFKQHFSIIRDICDPSIAFDGVTEDPIPVDFSGLPDGRFMSVKGGTHVPKHAHEGPVFRLITDGEAIVNGKSYTAGDWMVIPDGYAYEVNTEKGYTAFWNCGMC